MGHGGSVTVGRLGGIPIRLHFTLAIVLPYLAWAIARETEPLARLARLSPDDLTLPTWVLGVALASGLFLCVLLHELGHIAVGRAGGAKFRGVTLMLVGGVSEMAELPPRPMAEAAMAVAGPLVSLALSGVCYLGTRLATQADLKFAAFYLAYVNLALAAFNLLPAFPMDGGRALRALLSRATTRLRATRIAAGIGQVLALALLGLGILSGNWLLALIALFVIFGARSELNAVRTSALFEGLSVADALREPPPTADPMEPVGEALDRMRRAGAPIAFVLDRGVLVGALTPRACRAAPEATVGEAMSRETGVLSPETPLEDGARRLRLLSLPMLPVVEFEGLVGALSPDSVGRALRRRELELARTSAAARSRAPPPRSPNSSF